MEIKLFEVRDRGTTIILMAIRLSVYLSVEERMLARCGFETPGDYILIGNPDGGEFEMTYDSHNDKLSSTRRTADRYIREYWGVLKSGDVVDTEYIRGETSIPKKREI